MAFDSANVLENILTVLQVSVIILFLVLLALGFPYRNRPEVGGKIGLIRTIDPPPALPSGFS
jgi:hypothetical protein